MPAGPSTRCCSPTILRRAGGAAGAGLVPVPPGALTNKAACGPALPAAPPMPPADLLDLPMFAGISGTFLKLNAGSVVKRRFRPGEVICHEGEYGSTAF